MKKFLSLFLSVLLLSGLAGTVVAQDLPVIEIPINTVIRKPAGTKVPLVSKDVPQEYLGYICTANAVAKNQSSVHPNNDLIVSSNGTSVTMKDVERASGVSTPATGTLELGPTIDVTLAMGDHGVFSGGMVVALDCEQPEDPVYQCTALKAVRDTEDLKKFTFTTETETSDDVTVEKYVYDFGIDGEAPVETDKATVTKVYEDAGEYNVNVDVHFTIDGEEQATDSCVASVVIDDEPVVPTPEEPQVLPATGPGAMVAGVMGLSSLGYGAFSFHNSRKSLKDKILGRK